jgi:hypothetical protein
MLQYTENCIICRKTGGLTRFYKMKWGKGYTKDFVRMHPACVKRLSRSQLIKAFKSQRDICGKQKLSSFKKLYDYIPSEYYIINPPPSYTLGNVVLLILITGILLTLFF